MWMTIPFTMRSVSPFVDTRMTESPWKTPRADSMVFDSSVSHDQASICPAPSVQGARCAVPQQGTSKSWLCADGASSSTRYGTKCDRRPSSQRLCLNSVCNYEVFCKARAQPTGWHADGPCRFQAGLLVPLAPTVMQPPS